MKNSKIYKFIIRISLLVAILGLSTVAVFAWYIRMNTVGEIELKITKINSEVYLYESLDSNYNGIPDLLTDCTSEQISGLASDQFISDWPSKKYYNESRAFSYVAKEAALSVSKQGSIDMQMEMTGVYPTMTKTFKFACINNSDMENYITFSFNEKTYSATDILLLNTMSVRVGQVINNTNDTTSSDVSVVLSDKVYFCDFINGTSSTKFDVVGENDAYQIDGALNFTNNSNVKDFWFQFEMESLESLQAYKPSISLTKEQYQTLAGKSLTFPLMELALELRD